MDAAVRLVHSPAAPQGPSSPGAWDDCLKFVAELRGWQLCLLVLGGCCVWCLCAHCVFLRLCTCLRKRQKMSGRALKTGARDPYRILSAHRGGSCEGAENTLHAFGNAMGLGMNLLECDVHLTRDGQVVVCHDRTLGRLCGDAYAAKTVGDYDLVDLPPLQRRIRHTFAAGHYTLGDGENGGFTTLRQLFASCPDVYVSVDCKGGGEAVGAAVDDLIREYRREDLTVWGSMSPQCHRRIRRLNPDVPLFYTATEVAATYLWWLCGCLFCCPLPSEIFMPPQFTRERVAALEGRAARTGLRGRCVACALRLLRGIHRRSRALFRHLRARGNWVVMWVVNGREEMEECYELFGEDLDGIMTDCPTELAEFARRKGVERDPELTETGN